MKNILISLIGKGRTSENISKGYLRTKYKFRTGEVFETGFWICSKVCAESLMKDLTP